MKKKNFFILLFLIVICLSIAPLSVFADGKSGTFETKESLSTCTGKIGDPNNSEHPAYYLQKAFTVIKYAGIVLCIALTAYDFFQALVKDNKDGFKPALKNAIKRLCYALVLFFLPIIIKEIFSLVGVYGTCSIG